MTEQIQSRRMRASLLHPSGSWVLLGVCSSHSALPSSRFPQQLVVALCGWETATALGSGGNGGPAFGRQTACATPPMSRVTVCHPVRWILEHTHKHTHCRQWLLLAAVSPDFPRFSLRVCVCLCVSVWVSVCGHVGLWTAVWFSVIRAVELYDRAVFCCVLWFHF